MITEMILTRFLGGKMSKPNHLATHSERIIGKNALPRTLITHHDTHQKLTEQFRTLLKNELGENTNLCTVAHFAQDELVISVRSPTLVNHLTYLHDHLKQKLSTYEPFTSLNKIHWIYLSDSFSSVA